MATQYISKVQLPNNDTIYEIKDTYARSAIEQLADFTHYLGVTTTSITDGATTSTIVIGGVSWTAGTAYDEDNHKFGPGCIVTLNSGEDLYTAADFVWNGTQWQKFGNPTKLGKLAYKDSATVTGTITAASVYTGAAGSYPVTLSTTAVTGATSFKAVNTVGNYDKATSVTYDKITGVSYSKVTKATYDKATSVTYDKATGGTATVNSSATFTGTISAIKTATPTKTSYVVAVPVSTYVTDIPSSATATGTAVVLSTADIYGANSALTVRTGSETLNKDSVSVLTSVTASTNAVYATVSNEVLTFNVGTVFTTPTSSNVLGNATSLTAGATSTLVKKTFATAVSSVTQPTITIGEPSKNAAATLALSSVTTGGTQLVTGLTANAESISVSVKGNAVTNGAVTIDTYTSTSADINYTSTNAALTNTATAATITSASTSADIDYTATAVPVTTSTFYGQTTVASASHTHTINHTLSAN